MQDATLRFVDPRGLCGVHFAIPVCIGAAVADTAGGGRLIADLLGSPAAQVWYFALLGLPHIIASFFAYASPEYLRHYQRTLGLGVVAVIVAATWLNSLAPTRALQLFLVVTIVHFAGQQLGIARGFVAPDRRMAYQLWRVSLLGVCVSVGVGFPEPSAPGVFFAQQFLLLGSAIAWLRITWGQKVSSTGYLFLLCTQVLVTTAWALVQAGYGILAVVMFQLVHDLTAFQFYAAHDAAQHSGGANWLYDRLRVPPQLIWVALPILAIPTAALLTRVLPASVPLALTLLHYALEHRAWRTGSPHRRRIRIARGTA